MSLDYAFKAKIECVYEIIANNNISRLTKLFLTKDKNTSLDNRAMHIQNRWLNAKDTFVPRLFKSEYSGYMFSRLTINNKPIFKDANEFLNIELSEFCNRIKRYKKLILPNDKKDTLKYNHIYVFSRDNIDNEYKIDHYKITYKNRLSETSTNIELTLPKYKQKKFNTQKYKGVITIDSSKILLQFENSFDSATALFNHTLNSQSDNYTIGTIVGIADVSEVVPVAKKVVISKEEIKDYSWLYLLTNETETILADDNINNKIFNLNSNNWHVYRYINKLKDVESFLKNISKNYCKSFYYQLAFNEFYELNKTLELINNKSSYIIRDRVHLLKTLINSWHYEQFKELYLVVPMYERNNLFNNISKDVTDIKNGLIARSNKCKIEMIFIVNKCSENFTIEFKEFLNSIKNSNIEIYFADKGVLENKVNSLDFIFTNKLNFVTVKLLRATIRLFRFFNDEVTIKEYESIYHKIKNRAITYKEFYENSNKSFKFSSPLVEALSTTWYIYFYTDKLLEYKMVIHTNLKVELYYKNSIHFKGEVINKKHQSIILLEGTENERLNTIIFDNQLYKLKKAFIAKIVSKEYATNKDIITLCICSKKSIKLKDAEQILGVKEKIGIESVSVVNNRLREN